MNLVALSPRHALLLIGLFLLALLIIGAILLMHAGQSHAIAYMYGSVHNHAIAHAAGAVHGH